MFTGIVTDVGTVRSAEQRGDLRLTIATGYDIGDRRPRRVDRLLGRLPDRRRQGRRLVRGRCLGRNRVADRRGPVARRRAGSTSNARCGSATSSAAISSPAMSMRSAEVVEAPPGGRFDARSASRVPQRARRDDRRQGLDRARRRVADRQRRRAMPRRIDPFHRQHHPPHGAAHHARRASRPDDSSMSRSTCSRAIFERMMAARSQ